MARMHRHGDIRWQGVAPICDLGGGSNFTKYFAFPPHAHPLPAERRCVAIANDDIFGAPHMLPVTHTNAMGTQASDNHFFYYAPGCSDMYIKPGNILVAHDLHDASLSLIATLSKRTRWQVLEHIVLPHFRRKGGFVCGLSRSTAFLKRLALSPCTARSTAVNHPDGCLLRWTPGDLSGLYRAGARIIELGQSAKVDTIIFKYRGSGRDNNDFSVWKTEVYRALPLERDTFYDARLQRCTRVLGGEPKRCVVCKNSTLLRRACAM